MTNSPTGRASSSVSEWFPMASPKTTAAATRKRSPGVSVVRPLGVASSPPSGAGRTDSGADARLPGDEEPRRIATSARWSVCASAWVARLQAVGVRAIPRPASTPRIVERVSARTRSTVTPAATATHSAENRFIRNAGSPNGWRTTDASQPRMT